MKSIFDEYPGKWAMITTSSTRYVGRIISDEPGETVLQPVFDCFPQIDMDGGRIMREAMVLPFDITVDMETKIRILNANTVVYFDDLANSDRKEYEDRVEKAAVMAMHGRAQRSGISLTGQMPQQNQQQPHSPLIFR